MKALFRKLILKISLPLRQIHPPGFRGMDLYEVLRFFFRGLTDSKFSLMSAAMSYKFFFSTFSTLILIFAVIPQIPIEDLETKVMQLIQQVVPPNGIEFISGLVNGYLKERDTDLVFAVLMILFAFWGATRGIIAMMQAFTKNDEAFKKRNIFELYGTAFLIFLILGTLIILAASLLIVGDATIDYLKAKEVLSDGVGLFLLDGLRYLMTLLTIFLAISTLYYLAPATYQRWDFFSPGSIAAGVLILFAMFGLNFFVQKFSELNTLYGSLTAVIVLMVWFNFISVVLLIGFELNAAIELASFQQGKARQQAPPPPP
ncbi:MAG: YihY/virulence factor BrkB family protein, partial [Bacteroidota bacterium]